MRQQENLQLGIPRETAQRFPRRLQELCGYSVYKGQFGHIDNHDPIELLGRERGKNVTDVEHDRHAIAGAIAEHRRRPRPGRDLLYGDGKAGKRIADVLAMARPQEGADCVLSTSFDGFTVTTPLAASMASRSAC